MLKKVLYISASIIFFFAGLIAYGLILNSREVTLVNAMAEKGISSVKDVKLIIDRKNYKIELYSEKVLVKTYKAVFGKNTGTIKTSANDFVTPTGNYTICSIDTTSKFHKFFQLNYPNSKDAAEALKQGYLKMEEYNMLMLSEQKDECPTNKTKLGGGIGIHGIGEYDFIFRNLPFTFNWTNGSIAVSNQSIDELYKVVKIGTPVKITY